MKTLGHISGGPSAVEFAHELFQVIPGRCYMRGTVGQAVYSDVPLASVPPTLRRIGGDELTCRFTGSFKGFEVSAIGHLNERGDKFRHVVVSYHQ